jgi:hypothetical protein
MFRTSLTASIATLAVIAATPALAKPGEGAGMGAAGGLGASVSARPSTDTNVSVGARGNAHVGAANERGDVRANARSSVKADADIDSEPMTGTRIRTRDLAQPDSSTRVSANTRISANTGVSAQLTGVTDGMTVVDSGGATVGTVTGIRATGNGSVKNVQVTLTDGSVIVLSGNSLTLDGDVLTTNSLTTNVNSQGAAHANINGLVHASPNSALATAGVTTLTGLTAGLTVNETGGATLGTVSSILVNRSGAVVGINVALDGGGTVTIPATTLTMDGTTVVTTFTP